MKYFTRAWAEGELTDEAFEGAIQAYEAHVEGLRGRLPGAVAELVTSVNLHDALIRRVRVDRRAARLTIELRCGDLQAGYFDAILEYSGVSLDATDLAGLEARARDPDTEVLYDEVDVEADGRLCHRILFSPDGELDVRFASLALDRVAKDGREEPRPDDVYAEFGDPNASEL